MSTTSASRLLVPQNGLPTASQRRGEVVGVTGARKPPKHYPKTTAQKRAEDKRAAPWFDAGVAAFDKADAYADELVIDKSELSKMRSGEIAVALRRLLPMQKHAPSAVAFCEAFLAEVEVAEHPDQVLALVAPLLDAIGYVARPTNPVLTEVGLALIVLRGLMADGSPVMRKLVENLAAQFGHGPKHVAMALRGEEETK